MLSPICAEYLSAYDDTTGRPLTLLFGLLFFVPLYGAPALVVREVARRRDLGWPGIVLLALAAGVLQAGLVDQSLFTVDYRDIDVVADSATVTMIPVLGFGALNAVEYVTGHAIFSFGAPIALAEGVGGTRGGWVGRWGLMIAVLAWGVVAALICADTMRTEDGASPAQAVGAAVVVVALVAAALRCRPPRPREGRVPAPWLTLLAAAVIASGLGLYPVSWWGLLMLVTVVALLVTFLWVFGSRAAWTPVHTVAAALGVLVSRGLLAFLGEPLVGETTPLQKYGHNVAMLAIVLLAGAVAWRSAVESRAAGRTDGRS